jgi:hypothetical protein
MCTLFLKTAAIFVEMVGVNASEWSCEEQEEQQ